MKSHDIGMVGRKARSSIHSLGAVVWVLLSLCACGGTKPLQEDDVVVLDPPQLVSELVFTDPSLQECIDKRFITRIADITSLTCYDLKDLTGIGQLRELERLVIGGQDLELADLSENTNLKHLEINGTLALKSLDLSANTALESLKVIFTGLEELSLVNNSHLNSIYLEANRRLLSFNLQGCEKLETLEVWDSEELTAFSVFGAQNLSTLSLRGSPLLFSLKDFDADNLKTLNLSGLNLNKLDVSNNTMLTTLSLIETGISELNLQKNKLLESIEIIDPNLQVIHQPPEVSTLKWVTLSNTKISSFNTHGAESLTSLTMRDNQLTEVDLSTNARLKLLYLTGNQIRSIDLSNNLSLEKLELTNNPLSCQSIDAIDKQFSNLNFSRPKYVVGADDEGICTGADSIVNLPFSDIQLSYCVTQSGMEKISDLIELSCYWVEDLAGIEQLTYLEKLNIELPASQTLDLRFFPNLEFLTLMGSGLPPKVNLADAPQLKHLSMAPLDSLDLSSNTQLSSLELRGNKLPSLDLSPVSKLEHLSLLVDGLQDVDLSLVGNLMSLEIGGKGRKTVDLLSLVELRELKITDDISHVDLSMQSKLEALTIEGAMLDIDLSAQKRLKTLRLTGVMRELDLKELSSLELLESSYTYLETVVLPIDSSLVEIDLNRNWIEDLDLSSQHKLERLFVQQNPMEKLDISASPLLKKLIHDAQLFCVNMTALENQVSIIERCVGEKDEIEISDGIELFNHLGSIYNVGQAPLMMKKLSPM